MPYLFDKFGDRRLGYIKGAEAVCGKDFCDGCGDCLHCYMGEWCPDGGDHQWIVYHNHLPQFLERHPGAEVVYTETMHPDEAYRILEELRESEPR